MLLSGPSKGLSMEKFLSQNARYETKSFTELPNITKYLMKFEKQIHEYFPSLGKDRFAFIRNPLTANVQMLHTGIGTQKEQIKL